MMTAAFCAARFAPPLLLLDSHERKQIARLCFDFGDLSPRMIFCESFTYSAATAIRRRRASAPISFPDFAGRLIGT